MEGGAYLLSPDKKRILFSGISSGTAEKRKYVRCFEMSVVGIKENSRVNITAVVRKLA